MPTTPQPEQPRKKKRRIRPFWIMIGSPVIIVLLLAVAVGGHRLYVQSQIEQELREIAARGEPVDADELQADYAMPAGANDRTDEWLQVIEPIHAATKDSTYKQLPIIGLGYEESIPLTGEDWPDEPTIAKLMAELEPAFAELEELRENPGEVRYPVDFSSYSDMQFSYVQEVIAAARMLLLRARWQVKRGDQEGALVSLLTVRRVADTHVNAPNTAGQLVRTACYGIMVGDTLELLPYANWSDGQLARLQEEFLTENSFQHALHRSLVSERVTAIELYSDSDLPESVRPRYYYFAQPSDQLHWLQLFERMIAVSDLPYEETKAKFMAIRQELKAEEESEQQIWRHHFSHQMMPAALALFEPFTRANAYDRAAATLIACQRYHLANSSYPTKLNQLVPQYLNSVPIDPYDEQPLRYLLKAEEVIVYSVGRNMVDDGGESSQESGFTTPDMTLRLKIIEK